MEELFERISQLESDLALLQETNNRLHETNHRLCVENERLRTNLAKLGVPRKKCWLRRIFG